MIEITISKCGGEKIHVSWEGNVVIAGAWREGGSRGKEVANSLVSTRN